MQEFWGFPMSEMRSPITMGYRYRKHVRASSKSGRFSKVEGGRYVPMIGVCCILVMTSQLTMFGPWKRVASTL